MKVGFNLLLWTSHVTEQHYPLLPGLKKAGYDVRPLKANYKQLGEAGLETIEPKESPKAEGKK